jgi:hypothetical protein
MELKAFINLSSQEVCRLTDTHLSQWSRYLSKKTGLNERTLERMGSKLEMTPDTLLKGIIEKRRLLTK